MDSDGTNPFDLFSAIAECQLLTPSTEDLAIPKTDVDFSEFWYKNYLSYYGKSVKNTSENSSDCQKPTKDDLESNELQEILNHVPAVLPSQLPQRVGANRVNFILIATSLDEANILERLSNTLERETFRAIALPFEKKNQKGKVDNVPVHPMPVVNNGVVREGNDVQRLESNDKRPTQTLKRKQTEDIAIEEFCQEKRPTNKIPIEMS